MRIKRVIALTMIILSLLCIYPVSSNAATYTGIMH
jgi:hypothetical protein